MINVYDFFCGCGGASYGFQSAGMRIMLGIDNDPDAAATFKRNFPNAHFVQKDIREIQPQDLEEYVDRTVPMLFCGCAPCQPFSKQNKKKKIIDERINLLAEFGRFVAYYRPDFIFVENVPGIQNFPLNEGPLADFCLLLSDLEYRKPVIKVIPAMNYGVPQVRKRLILIAGKNHDVEIPKQTHGPGTENPEYSTVADWISGLPWLEAGMTDPNDEDHCVPALSEINLKRIRSTPPGGNREAWPKEYWLDCHKKHSGHSDVYGRLSFDRPASALTTKCISYSNGRFGHPVQDRAISVREAACLQTFPRHYRFSGSMISKAKQIGNAVPPLMAKRFGEMFLRKVST